ncbi:segregation/condensation protein A [Marinisporobacter balticus]|uniref:Segregation and condensation protein A n=1 Tax=Marinisporobacter balticus TaxID=2018667 RepID=A0A4R2L751_9FIRM|nr:segregation/condensation protein A [Marinisporobacter balticus]TCO79826.1 condensin subunit ScpA [Marinisporobacter balticus]
MTYQIKLEAFEGPFDLLFHLIEKAKVDIYNIPIAEIAEQYVQYIEDIKKFDLEITSEFLVMAATLIEIKSKMLLPNKKEEQLEMDIVEEDPREALVKRLIEYKKYKNAATEFKNREEIYTKFFYKQPEQFDQFVRSDTQELGELEMKDLLDAFNRMLKKRKKINQNRIHIKEIKREEITLEDKIKQVKNLIYQKNSLEFEKFFINSFDKSEIVVTFLAILELMKLKFIVVEQNGTFGNMVVTRNIENDER